jgi:hypothetical protein
MHKTSKIANRRFSVAGERCCSPNNSLKDPKVNDERNNGFMHPGVFGKTYAFSHEPETPPPQRQVFPLCFLSVFLPVTASLPVTRDWHTKLWSE